MKKHLQIICLLVVMIFSIVGLSACNSSNADKNKTTPNSVVFADFESWKPNFQLMRLLSYSGRCTHNTDLAFVHDGVGSAKFEPLGKYTNGAKATFYMPTSSKLFDFDYRDFSKVDYINMWVYNDSDEVKNLTVGLISDIVNIEEIKQLDGEAFQIQPKTWQEVMYVVDFEILNLLEDVNPYSITAIEGIYFSFDNAQSRYYDGTTPIYIDNIEFYYKEEAMKLVDIKNEKGEVVEQVVKDIITLDENEVIDFEKIYQKYMIRSDISESTPACIPNLEVVSANDYGLIAPSGNNMLKLTMNFGEYTGSDWQVWSNLTSIVLPKKLLDKSRIKSVAPEKYDKTYFSFEVYNDCDYEMKFYIYLWTENMQQRSSIQGFTIQPKTWLTYRVSLADIEASCAGMVSNLGVIKIRYGSAYKDDKGEFDKNQRVFFFDNFRVEEKATGEAI
jgi:hypothetical protein